MNPVTGRIVTIEFGKPAPPATVPMILPPTPRQLRRMRVGRNEPCPCGSGRKFKQCCYSPRRR